MAELSNTITLNNKFQNVATLSGISFDTTKTYFLQNLGNTDIYLIESTDEPTDNSVRGIMLKTGNLFTYKPTASYDLYALGMLSQLTIIEKIA